MPYVDLEQVIVGTAGHIDHGKTALVKALTGVDTDTLAEEKRRGITIELGFAFLETPGFDKQIMFIDVPGHEKLIKTMVAGSSNLDAALLVIAVDEGIGVQTIEHFDILQLFGVEAGIIALTKTDLVDAERIRAVTAEVEAMAAGTFLEGAPIIPVSAVTGVGVDEVRNALLAAVHRTRKRRDNGIFRMPIDRVFVMPGFGVVIAGTILGGEVNVGDKLEVLPEGIPTRVRGIQVHSEAIQRSLVGRRTAINLQDVKKEQLRRGQCICAPGAVTPTTRLDARLFVLRSYDAELRNRERVSLHIGSDEVMCRVVLLDSEKLGPGRSGLVQLALESPTTALRNDRFVIRSFSTMKTIGGGAVLDPYPLSHRRWDADALKALLKFEGGTVDAVEQTFLKSRAVPRTALEVSFAIGEHLDDVVRAVEELRQAGKLVEISPRGAGDAAAARRAKFLHSDACSELSARLVEFIGDFYTKEPYRQFMPILDLYSRFSKLAGKQVFEALVTDLCTRGVLAKVGSKVGLADRRTELKPGEQDAAERIETIFRDAGFATPLEEDVMNDLEIGPESFRNIMTALVDQGRLVRVSDKVTYHKDYVERARQLVIDYIRQHRSITAAELRDELGLSRKYTTALLEYFDSVFLTRRDGDRRVLQ